MRQFTENHGLKKLLLSLFFVVISSGAFADDAKLTNINITNNRDDLLLFLTLEGAFREKLQKAVLSGVPATFSYYVGLYRVRSLWLDKDIKEIKLTHTIKYDNLKKEFTVKRSWQDNDPVTTPSFEEAQRLMTEINGLVVYPLNQLEKGKQYQIRTKAEVDKITLPLYLHYVLIFVSFWDFETDWYTIDFIY
jgi:hypothetical protein